MGEETTVTAIKALLERHMATSEQRHVETVRQWSELHTTVKHHGSELAVLYERVNKVEGATRKAMDSQADLEGDLLREVGALAANDARQNAELKEQTKKLDELVDDKKQVKAYAKAIGAAVIFAPGVWSFLQWAVAHAK